jgi:glycine/D-amino acid oxidase-like deaminating enzyme/nitrite reductase/ring-hydroxylating ferredoxin subunit
MAQTQSLWLATKTLPEYPALDHDLNTDVCVIGAGIAGLTTAYHLARAGKRVIVLEDGRVGSGETGRTTAHLTAALDDRYWNLERMHGADGARLAAESHMAAINRAQEIVRAERIECEFQRVSGYLVAPEGRSPAEHRERMEMELDFAQRASICDLELLERAPIDSWNTGLALHFPRQAQFKPLAFLDGLARSIVRDGGRIFENTHVQGLEAGTPVTVKADNGRSVTAGAVAVCTNASISDFWITHIKQAPYRTYVVAARVRADSVPAALYWDDDDPYHYVRVARSAEPRFDWLIVGGEDHKTGHKDDAGDRFHALEEWTRSRFPQISDFVYHWSGQVLEPFDYLSFTGRTPDGSENVYMHSGDSGNGITHGLMAGMLLTDLILGRENSWAHVYDPKRVSLKAAPEFIRQNLDVAAQFRDYLRPANVHDEAAIPAGEGRVLLRAGKRIAAYRDEQGRLHERSAVCTHLKCIVHWNSLEKSWDCPCHGSRFDPLGTVLNGPALMPLEEEGKSNG